MYLRNNQSQLNTVILHLMRDLSQCAMIFLISCTPILFSIPACSQTKEESIKIGFLIRDKNDLDIQRTAELAIQEANAKGGYKGQKFELVIRSCDGPWGITSKQTVALIFEDKVPIVVTALDGRNAHLAEQVTAKSHVVMLSTLSSDPTLSRAYVPWYFRMVPDDKQQANVLVQDIYKKGKAQMVAVIAFDNYDGKTSAEAFTAKARELRYPKPEVFTELNEDEVIEKINGATWDAILLAGTPKDATKFANLSKSQNTFAFLNFFNFLNSDEDFSSINTSFSPSMDYVYDGISLAIESIKKYGADSEEIRQGFRDLQYHGITGKIEFDMLGNRLIE